MRKVKDFLVKNGEIIGCSYDIVFKNFAKVEVSRIVKQKDYREFLATINDNKVSDKLKNGALTAIREAISINRKEECQNPVYLNYVCFGLGAPDSYDLMLEYYDTLYECCLRQKDLCGIKNGIVGKFYNNKKRLESKINNIKVLSLLTFMDTVYSKTSMEIMEEVNLPFKYLSLYYSYMNNINDTINSLYCFDSDKAIKDFLLEIYLKIINGETVSFLGDKYKLSIDRLINLVREYLGGDMASSLVSYLDGKKQDEVNTKRECYNYNYMALALFESMAGNVVINDEFVKFSILDYFVYSHEDLLDFRLFIWRMSYDDYIELNPSVVLTEKTYYNFRGILADFLFEQHKHFISYKTPKSYDSFVSENNYIIKEDGSQYYLNDYLDEIFRVFDDRDIPCSDINVKIAFSRVSDKLPILPFEEEKFKHKVLKRQK